MATPDFPAPGVDAVNTAPYLVEALIVAAGEVLDWTIADAKGVSQTFTAGLSVGQTFMLALGDRIDFNYAQAPAWKWRALG